jgi:hypothetical protein
MNRETSITVTHEDLQWVLTAITTPLGGLHLVKHCHQRPGRVQLDPDVAVSAHRQVQNVGPETVGIQVDEGHKHERLV